MRAGKSYCGGRWPTDCSLNFTPCLLHQEVTRKRMGFSWSLPTNPSPDNLLPRKTLSPGNQCVQPLAAGENTSFSWDRPGPEGFPAESPAIQDSELPATGFYSLTSEQLLYPVPASTLSTCPGSHALPLFLLGWKWGSQQGHTVQGAPRPSLVKAPTHPTGPGRGTTAGELGSGLLAGDTRRQNHLEKPPASTGLLIGWVKNNYHQPDTENVSGWPWGRSYPIAMLDGSSRSLVGRLLPRLLLRLLAGCSPWTSGSSFFFFQHCKFFPHQLE